MTRLALTPFFLVQITLKSRTAALERVAIDGDEHDGLRPRRAIHPDRRGHGSRARVESLPHAPGRPAITPARRHLPLALFEAIIRKRLHNVLGRGDPSVLLFHPGHPALLAKLAEAVHGPHRVLLLALADRHAEVDRLLPVRDRKSTRLNSSHLVISYAVFCLKKKNIITTKCYSRM